MLGLQSFMTSEEMTTGSLSATEAERKVFAQRSRWWNSTGGGSSQRTIPGVATTGSNGRGFGAIRSGDGGKKFKEEWPELDEENWKWMEENRIDPATGRAVAPAKTECNPEASALRRRPTGSGAGIGEVVEGAQVARDAGQGFLGRNKLYIAIGVLFAYVILARILGEAEQ